VLGAHLFVNPLPASALEKINDMEEYDDERKNMIARRGHMCPEDIKHFLAVPNPEGNSSVPRKFQGVGNSFSPDEINTLRPLLEALGVTVDVIFNEADAYYKAAKQALKSDEEV
jgi:hypothetical protein